MSNRYFFYGDILGFSQIVNSLSLMELKKRLIVWGSLVEKLITKYKIKKYLLVSDSLSICANSKDELILLINFCRELLEDGVNNSLPIRGAITYGEYNWEENIYGKAVTNAIDLEKKQNWIGVIIDSSVDLVEDDYNNLNLICYPVPIKNGDIKLSPTVNWNVPSFDELSIKLTMNGLGGVPGIGKKLDWDWSNKMSNTIMYGIYTHALKLHNKEPSKFHCMHPMQLIDNSLRKQN